MRLYTIGCNEEWKASGTVKTYRCTCLKVDSAMSPRSVPRSPETRLCPLFGIEWDATEDTHLVQVLSQRQTGSGRLTVVLLCEASMVDDQ